MSERLHTEPMPEGEYFDGRRFTGLSILLGVIAVISLALCLVGAFVNPHQFSYSWLFAFVFFFTLCAGCFFWTIVHHATDADWSVVVRRQLENIAVLLGVLALLFIPILLLRRHLYSWMDIPPGHEVTLDSKRAYLNFHFVLYSHDYLLCLLDRCVSVAAAIFLAPGQRRKPAVHHLDAPGVVHQPAAVCPLSHIWRVRLDDEP